MIKLGKGLAANQATTFFPRVHKYFIYKTQEINENHKRISFAVYKNYFVVEEPFSLPFPSSSIK